jgi:hypothetical protein
VLLPLTALVAVLVLAVAAVAGWRLLAAKPEVPTASPAIEVVLSKPTLESKPVEPTLEPPDLASIGEPPAVVVLAEPEPEPAVEPKPAVAPPPVVVVKADPKVEPKPEPTPALFKRIRPSPNTDELTRQLFKVKEVELDKTPNGPATRDVLAHAQANKSKVPHPTPAVLTRRADLAGLPMRMGVDCHLGKESAKALEVLSRKLRTYLSDATKANAGRGGAAGFPVIDDRADVAALRARLDLDGAELWQVPEAEPTLVQ